jgi:hypothetical protein
MTPNEGCLANIEGAPERANQSTFPHLGQTQKEELSLTEAVGVALLVFNAHSSFLAPEVV